MALTKQKLKLLKILLVDNFYVYLFLVLYVIEAAGALEMVDVFSHIYILYMYCP